MSIGPWDLNGFDVAVLLVLLISLLMAASRGLMREIVSIIALLISIVLTLFVMGQFGIAARDFISPTWLADGILGVGTFAFSYMLFVFLFSGINKQLKGKDVGFIDRILGAGFGAGRGLLLASLAVMAITQLFGATPPSTEDQTEMQVKLPPDLLQNAAFYPMLDRIGDGIRALPFIKIKKAAQDLKDGNLDGLIDDLGSEEKPEETGDEF